MVQSLISGNKKTRCLPRRNSCRVGKSSGLRRDLCFVRFIARDEVNSVLRLGDTNTMTSGPRLKSRVYVRVRMCKQASKQANKQRNAFASREAGGDGGGKGAKGPVQARRWLEHRGKLVYILSYGLMDSQKCQGQTRTGSARNRECLDSWMQRCSVQRAAGGRERH